jgi:hypothetical protein
MTGLEMQQPIKISNLNGCLLQNFSLHFERRTSPLPGTCPLRTERFRLVVDRPHFMPEKRHASFCYESIPSDTSSASSTSIPRYLTVLYERSLC